MIELKTVKLTNENLKIIKEIDDTFYQDKALTLDWYLERYNENHQGILLYKDSLCIGYLVSVPIKEELYQALTNGVLTNDIYINPRMYVPKSNYNYIVSVLVLEEYRHLGYGKLLLKELLNNNQGKYCALTITKEGYNLAKESMNHLLKINDNVNVFNIEL